MYIHVNQGDGVPIYLQIVNQVKLQIASGTLNEGQELPPIRVLAKKILINPNTVARAYRELEMAGLVTKRQGSGTFVSSQGSPLEKTIRQRLIRDRVVALLAEARQMRISTESLIEIMKNEDAAMKRELKENP